MPRRPSFASTTLATALTIPVNICVGADQDVIPEADEVEVGEPGGIAQMLDAFSAERPGCVLAPDEPRRDVRVNLVDEALGEEGRVDLPTALYEQADQVALAELVEQGWQRDTAFFCRRQIQDLGQPDAAGFRRCDERVRADHPRRLADAKLRVEDDADRLARLLAIERSEERRVGKECRSRWSPDC